MNEIFTSSDGIKWKNITSENPTNHELGFTKEEALAHDKLMECYDLITKLKAQHPDEMRYFTDAIHIIQSGLAMRVVRRSYPKGWGCFEQIN